MEEFVPELDIELSTVLVLHVDDEPDFTAMTAEMLGEKHEAFQVTTANSATEAVEVLDEAEVHCVVSDYDMPGQTGLELLRTVRERDPELPFILFTGKGSEEIASQAISEGVSDYLQKRTSPDQFDILAKRIENTVKTHHAKQEFRRLKRRYELIAKSTTDALWDWTIEGGEVDMEDPVRHSSGFYRSFGYEDEEVSDEFSWWAERVHPDDREDAIAAINEVLENGEEYYEDTHRFRHADGSYARVLLRGYVEYEDGEPAWMVGTLVNRDTEPAD